jgi:hypothetical protein
MGAAGAATGVMTGEMAEAEPVSGPVSLPGNIQVVDPATGTPLNSFVTDANGELSFGVVPSAGQTEVAVTVGAETYVVDLAVAAGTGVLEVVYDHVDFIDASTGYMSTATLTPNFGGTVTGTVAWAVTGVTNTGAFWKRGGGDKHGLTWGPAAGTYIWTNTIDSFPSPTGLTAQLSDIVGDRDVVVTATAMVDGVLTTKTLNLHFGHGPLSVFNGTINFATWSNYNARNPFTSVYATFPAAGVCGGTVDNTSINPTSVGSDVIFTNPSTWDTYSIGTNLFGYSKTSKLPTVWRKSRLSPCTMAA